MADLCLIILFYLFLELFENEHVRIGQKGKLLIILMIISENETQS